MNIQSSPLNIQSMGDLTCFIRFLPLLLKIFLVCMFSACTPFERLPIEDIMPELMYSRGEKDDEDFNEQLHFKHCINPVDWGGTFTKDFPNIY